MSAPTAAPLLTVAARDRALAAAALAAPPAERLASRAFVAVPTPPGRVASRVEGMRAALGGDHGQATAATLRALGWTAADLEAAVQDVALRPGAERSGWVGALVSFLEHVAAGGAPSSGTPLWRVEHALRTAGRLAAGRLLAGAGVAAADQALDDLGRQVSGRLLAVLAPGLDFEARLHAAAGQAGLLDGGVDGWLARLEVLPGTAYLLGTTWLQWQSATAEMARRLRDDWAALRGVLGAAPAAPAVDAVGGDAGDLHQEGRASALLRVGDTTVVYKPRDSVVTRAYLELERLAAAGGAMPAPYPRAVVARDGYGWESYVAPLACGTREDARSFYTRLGGTLRLLELVEARDLWLDNLVAAGGFPVFVDLETVLSARRPAGTGASRAAGRAQHLLEESAAFTGILVAATPIAAGVAAEDVGAVTRVRRLRLPYRPRLDGLAGLGGAGNLDDLGFVRLAPTAYVPWLDDRPVPVTDHLGELLAGYRGVDGWLAAHAGEAVELLERHQRVGDAGVRYLHSDTWSYARAVQASVTPGVLVDGIERDVQLWRLVPATGPVSSQAAWIRLREVSTLRTGNVPYFTTRPGSRGLYAEDGSCLPGFFERSSSERLAQRVRRPALALDERVRIVETSLGCAQLGGRRGAGRQRGALTVDAGRAVELAGVIGDLVVSAAVVVGREVAWYGLTYEPVHDCERLGVLDDDLLTGTGGLAVLLAELFAATGERRYREITLAALEAVAERRHRASPAAGGFLGSGGVTYTFRRCARLLGGQVPPCPVPGLPGAGAAGHPLDVVRGAAGAVLGAEPSAQAVAWWDAWGRAGGRGRPLPYPPGARRLDALPGPSVAAGLVEAHLGPASGGAHARAAGAVSLALPTAAARTRPGNALALVQLGDRRAGPLLAGVVGGLGAAGSWSSRRLLDTLEVVLAGRRRGHAGCEEASYVLAGHLAARGRGDGRWFPERLASPHHDLSAVWGVPAVALALLGVADPARVRPVRILA